MRLIFSGGLLASSSGGSRSICSSSSSIALLPDHVGLKLAVVKGPDDLLAGELSAAGDGGGGAGLLLDGQLVELVGGTGVVGVGTEAGELGEGALGVAEGVEGELDGGGGLGVVAGVLVEAGRELDGALVLSVLRELHGNGDGSCFVESHDDRRSRVCMDGIEGLCCCLDVDIMKMLKKEIPSKICSRQDASR